MIRGIGAQLAWSLKVDARSVHSHLLRLLFVVTLMISVLFAYATWSSVGAPGLKLFQSICFLNLALILLGGISYFSTSVTEEKESESLALLKLAGMGPLSILLGKFVSRLISSLMLLPVQLPFTLLAITLGGVTISQIFAAYTALAAFLCFVATIALICSIRCNSSGAAAGVTGVIVLILFVTPLVIRTSVAMPAGGKPVKTRLASIGETIESVSILGRLEKINKTGFNESPISRQVVTHMCLSVILFLFGWLIFEPMTANLSGPQRQSGMFTRKSPLRALGVPRCGSGKWANAFIWKDFYFLTGGKTFFIGRLVGFGLLLVAILAITKGASGQWMEDAGLALFYTMLIFICLETSIYSARIFFDEIRWHSLPSLVLTPNTTAVISWGKVRGALLSLIPALIYCVVAFVMAPVAIIDLITTPLAWFILLQYITFLHLAALLSLHIRWGALPLALVVTAVLNNCCPVLTFGVFVSQTMSTENRIVALGGMLIGFVVYWLVILFPIECEIAARLRKVAGK